MADASDLEDEINKYILLTFLLLRRNQRRRRAAKRNTWSKSWIKRRKTLGMHANLVQELNAEDPSQFRAFYRLDRESFFHVLSMVKPFTAKQDTILRPATSTNPAISLRESLHSKPPSAPPLYCLWNYSCLLMTIGYQCSNRCPHIRRILRAKSARRKKYQTCLILSAVAAGPFRSKIDSAHPANSSRRI